MPLSQLDVGFALADVTRLLRCAFDGRLRHFGLTGSTRRVIAYLARENGLTQAMLAHRLEISRVAAGEAIDRLERSGHVERRADPSDRRKWRVHLTQRSRDLLPLLAEAAESLQDEIFQDLSNSEVQSLKESLDMIRCRLVRMKIETQDEDE